MHRKIVGSLIYAMLTQLDMLHGVGVLSQFLQVLKKPQLDVAHRALHYLKSMLNYGIFYAHEMYIEAFGYIDVDWVGCAYERRSMFSNLVVVL